MPDAHSSAASPCPTHLPPFQAFPPPFPGPSCRLSFPGTKAGYEHILLHPYHTTSEPRRCQTRPPNPAAAATAAAVASAKFSGREEGAQLPTARQAARHHEQAMHQSPARPAQPTHPRSRRRLDTSSSSRHQQRQRGTGSKQACKPTSSSSTKQQYLRRLHQVMQRPPYPTHPPQPPPYLPTGRPRILSFTISTLVTLSTSSDSHGHFLLSLPLSL